MRWSPPLLIGVAMRQDREGEIPIRTEWEETISLTYLG